jgi:hypothetical protein
MLAIAQTRSHVRLRAREPNGRGLSSGTSWNTVPAQARSVSVPHVEIFTLAWKQLRPSGPTRVMTRSRHLAGTLRWMLPIVVVLTGAISQAGLETSDSPDPGRPKVMKE